MRKALSRSWQHTGVRFQIYLRYSKNYHMQRILPCLYYRFFALFSILRICVFSLLYCVQLNHWINDSTFVNVFSVVSRTKLNIETSQEELLSGDICSCQNDDCRSNWRQKHIFILNTKILFSPISKQYFKFSSPFPIKIHFQQYFVFY